MQGSHRPQDPPHEWTDRSREPRPDIGPDDDVWTTVGPTRSGGLARAARGAARATVATARLTGTGAKRTYSLARRASHADGAGESGLYHLIEIHFFSIMGDTLVALALAGTVFFSMPTSGGGSRAQIALFLLLTMLPFVFLAPFIGPFLDRYRQGRRWAIGATMGLRAILCIVLAGALGGLSPTQFLATLGVLVASKAYNVSRIAGTPRLLPRQLTLVKANGRMSMAGVVGATLAAPLGIALGQLGPEWILYLACAVFGVATVLSVLLPVDVDGTRDDEEPLPQHSPRRTRVTVPPPVRTGFRVNAGLRALSGFLMVFMAFVMLAEPFPGWSGRETLLLGIVVGTVGVGNAIGTALAALVRSRAPSFVLALVLLLDAAATVVCAVRYELLTTLVLAAVAGLSQQMGKLALDALIQRTVPEPVHTTMFGRSETVLQLAFVLGAFLGLIPMPGEWGMVVAAVLLVAWTVAVQVLRGRSLRGGTLSGVDRVRTVAPPPPASSGRSVAADHVQDVARTQRFAVPGRAVAPTERVPAPGAAHRPQTNPLPHRGRLPRDPEPPAPARPQPDWDPDDERF